MQCSYDLAQLFWMTYGIIQDLLAAYTCTGNKIAYSALKGVSIVTFSYVVTNMSDKDPHFKRIVIKVYTIQY